MNYAMLLARGRRAPKSAGATITFTQQPADQSAIDGTATFSALAVVSDESLPTYQWQKQEGGAGLWSNVSGATSSSLSLSGLTFSADNGDKYRVVASSPATASVAATLSVPAPVITITQQPVNQTASSGVATFSVAAASSSASAITYQWQRSIDGGETFENLLDENSPSLSLSGLTASSNDYQYRVVINSEGAAAETSTAATLVVPFVTITTQPEGNTYGANPGSHTFSVSATANSGATLSYQWQRLESQGVWQNVSGATSSSFVSSQTGTYRVVVSSSLGVSVTSSSASWTWYIV